MQSFVFTNNGFTRCLSQYRSETKRQFQHDTKMILLFRPDLKFFCKIIVIQLNFQCQSICSEAGRYFDIGNSSWISHTTLNPITSCHFSDRQSKDYENILLRLKASTSQFMLLFATEFQLQLHRKCAGTRSAAIYSVVSVQKRCMNKITQWCYFSMSWSLDD